MHVRDHANPLARECPLSWKCFDTVKRFALDHIHRPITRSLWVYCNSLVVVFDWWDGRGIFFSK